MTDLQKNREYWSYMVIIAVSIQISCGILLGYWSEVFYLSVAFLVYAYCFYVCLENHEDRIKNYEDFKNTYQYSLEYQHRLRPLD